MVTDECSQSTVVQSKLGLYKGKHSSGQILMYDMSEGGTRLSL